MGIQQKADAARIEELFEAAKLTEIQRRVARLAISGHTYGQMAECLGVPIRTAVSCVSRAESRLRQHQSMLVGRLYRQMRDLLRCVANVRDTRPARIHLYRERSFGWEKDPVTTRARCYGEVPEDLVRGEKRLLRWLPELLREEENPERLSAG